jgi:hypothetical protein
MPPPSTQLDYIDEINWTECAPLTPRKAGVSLGPANSEMMCGANLNVSGPVEADVDVHYSSVRFNGSFYRESIYRQAPSPEVDAAWGDLGVDRKFDEPRPAASDMHCQ